MATNNAIDNTLPSPFNVGATSVTSTGVQLNYLNGLTAVPINKVIVQTFTSNGTYTPTAGMVYCQIECLGGGGGGGGLSNTGAGTGASAGGGGAGSYSRIVSTAATIGASKAVTVGAGGTAGANTDGTGGNGGDTSVGTICIGKGGSGGVGGNTGAGGNGGVAGTGAVTTVGNNGGNGANYALITLAPTQGLGAASIFGGAPGAVTTAGAPGKNASNYGSGGNGASSFNADGAQIGGTGSAGIVIITEFVSA